MLADEAKANHIADRPSLLVVTPEDDDALLAAAKPRLNGQPVLLIVSEPEFARRLEGGIRQRAAALGVNRVAAVALMVDDPADLKGGGMLQVLFDLRQAGFCDHLGLAQPDARHAEWLAQNTAVRLLLTDYSLTNQQAAYRALPAAAEAGMACLALNPPGEDEAALRFAMGSADRVLAVMDRPVPTNLTPMSADELEDCWERYKMEHEPPAPLLRSQPPS